MNDLFLDPCLLLGPTAAATGGFLDRLVARPLRRDTKRLSWRAHRAPSGEVERRVLAAGGRIRHVKNAAAPIEAEPVAITRDVLTEIFRSGAQSILAAAR